MQLIYSLPDGFRLASTVLVYDGQGRPLIEVASFAMLPGSRARGADGVVRTYEVVRDVDPLPATPGLLAAVEASVPAEMSDVPVGVVDPTDVRRQLNMVLGRIAAAGEGQRNYAFTENALPAIRLCSLLGEDPESVLTMAYENSGGDDDRWVKAAIRSAVQRAAGEFTGRRGLGVGAQNGLLFLQRWGRFASWPGPSGPSDRRVFLAIVSACLEQGRMNTALGSRKLGLRAGLSKETVEASLKRLVVPPRSWRVPYAASGLVLDSLIS